MTTMYYYYLIILDILKLMLKYSLYLLNILYTYKKLLS